MVVLDWQMNRWRIHCRGQSGEWTAEGNRRIGGRLKWSDEW